MKSILTINRLIFALTALIVLLSLYIFWSSQYKSMPEIKCTSYIEQWNNKEEYRMNSSFIFSFERNGTGLISIDGKLHYKKNEYTLNRNIKVTYKKMSDNIWEFTSMKTTKQIADNTPDNLITRFFYSIDDNEGHYMILSKVNDNWLIGSIRSPAFICQNR